MNTPVRSTPAAAVVSLVFGILAWVALPLIGAIVAVVSGHVARGEIRRMPAGTSEGESLALIGLLLGYIQLALLVWVAILYFGWIMVWSGALH